MIAFLIHLVIGAALLMLVARLVEGIDVTDGKSALLAALVLGFVNAFVRPLLVLLTLPLTVVTLGLFLFVLNALMLQLVARIVPGFRVAGFGPALVGSLVLTVLNIGVSMSVRRMVG